MEEITTLLGVLIGTGIAQIVTRRREKRGERIIPFYLFAAEALLLIVGGKAARKAYRGVHGDNTH